MRYFVGYNLEGDDARMVDELRIEIAEKFSVQGALRLPPHLTIFPPFELEESKKALLVPVLEQFAKKREAFSLAVTDFNHFDETVWFIDVEQSAVLFDLKTQLAGILLENFAVVEDLRGRKGPHFHITLAYKDVTPEKFGIIGEFLKGKKVPVKTLRVGAITLFAHRDEKWLPAGRFGFESE